MTGPEHYRRAEKLIIEGIKEVRVAEAHIHALLALAAATAVSPPAAPPTPPLDAGAPRPARPTTHD